MTDTDWDLAAEAEARLLAYAQKSGQTVERLRVLGVQVVTCLCRMPLCPGWRAKWPYDDDMEKKS